MRYLLPENYRNDIIEYLPNAYAYHKVILDDQGRPMDYIFLDVNLAFEETTGLKRKTIIGERATKVLPGIRNDQTDLIEEYGKVAISGKSIKLLHYAKDLSSWYKITAYSDKKGYFTTIFNNITSEKETEFKLRAKERELEETQKLAKLGRWDYYHLENSLKWNNSVYEIFGKDLDNFQVTYENFLKTIHHEDRHEVNEAWKESLREQRDYIIEHRISMDDGAIKWVKEECKTDFDSDGDPIHTIGIVQDITDMKLIEIEREEKQKEIEYLSFYDHLTKLYNRRFFETEMERLDTNRNLPISIIFGDVNGLKNFNNLYGHAVGDELLIKIADILREACRSDDIIARIGGDEFAILLPSTNGYDAERIIERIKLLSSKEKVMGLDVSIALGYGIKQNDMDKIEDIIKNAEDHMYDNKFLEGRDIQKNTMNEIVSIIEEKYPKEKEYFKNAIRLYEKMSKRKY